MYREGKDQQMNQASGTKHQAKGGPADPVAWHAPRLYLQGPTPVYFLVSRQKTPQSVSFRAWRDATEKCSGVLETATVRDERRRATA
ncbi:hypothetical protein KQX54_007475 [Cotesia glomerata]|uniref:Uncharacterized protein n=1 Tax=Cotesia glomerata TaxID=32391 RepID=A0AAV7IAH8_COTGL|nr:hypothetical protein KQX54_007475 [Cotesia glomerata]